MKPSIAISMGFLQIFTLSAQRGIIKLSKEVNTMLVAAFAFYSAVISFLANSYALIRQVPLSLLFIIPIFLFVNLFAGCSLIKTKRRSLKICCHGTVLLVCFCISIIVSVIYHIILAVKTIPGSYPAFIGSLVFCCCVISFSFGTVLFAHT